MKSLKITLASLLGLVLIGAFTWIFLSGALKARVLDVLQFSAAVANSNAVKAMKEQDLTRASNELSQGLAASPEENRLHFNLGLVMQLMKKGEDSEKSYKQVLKSPRATPAQKFMVEYNLGRAEQEAKEIDKALLHYQAALDLNPDSRETKVNIELLLAGGGGGGGKGDEKNKDKPKEGEGKDPGDKPDKPKEYAPNKAPQKPQFKSEDLSASDVNKILGELKQQEQRIRGEYNRKDAKEPARGKDW